MDHMQLQLEYLDNYRKEWPPLHYVHKGDSGFDLRAALDKPVTLVPGRVHAVPVGVVAHIPPGYELQVRSKSGQAKRGLVVANGVGTVDAGYRGELTVLVIQLENRPTRITPGDRIAQAVIAPVIRAELVPYNGEAPAPVDERGDGGFGSTGTD